MDRRLRARHAVEVVTAIAAAASAYLVTDQFLDDASTVLSVLVAVVVSVVTWVLVDAWFGTAAQARADRTRDVDTTAPDRSRSVQQERNIS